MSVCLAFALALTSFDAWLRLCLTFALAVLDVGFALALPWLYFGLLCFALAFHLTLLGLDLTWPWLVSGLHQRLHADDQSSLPGTKSELRCERKRMHVCINVGINECMDEWLNERMPVFIHVCMYI